MQTHNIMEAIGVTRGAAAFRKAAIRKLDEVSNRKSTTAAQQRLIHTIVMELLDTQLFTDTVEAETK